MLIERVRAELECATGEEQCEIKHGRWCMNQVIAVKQVCEKYLALFRCIFGSLSI